MNEKSNIADLLVDFFALQEHYKDRFKNGPGLIGITTGYEKLDSIIDGFRPEHLWVLGGYTNTGKTAASLNFVSNLIKNKKRVLYFSLEMSKTDIIARLFGIMTNQSGLTILKGYQHDSDIVLEASKLMIESSLSIFNEVSKLDQMEALITQECSKSEVSLVVIDFLQLVKVKDVTSIYDRVTEAIQTFQILAKKTKVTFLVLSQVSNDGARNGGSEIMSFKGSGDIAAAADLAIEIKNGEASTADLKQKLAEGKTVEMMWDIRKNRHGRIGSIDMEFNGKTGVFGYTKNNGINY